MKHYKLVVSLVTIILTSFGCERDDLCALSGETTPNAVIEFYDFYSQENKKAVFNLIAIGIGNEEPPSNYTLVSDSKIVLPLKTTENKTQFTIIKEATINDNGTPDDSSDDFFEGNGDTITFNYSRKNVFVSKACGYKTIFENVTLTIENDSDEWMLSHTPINPNQSVEDEESAHFNIYH